MSLFLATVAAAAPGSGSPCTHSRSVPVADLSNGHAQYSVVFRCIVVVTERERSPLRQRRNIEVLNGQSVYVFFVTQQKSFTPVDSGGFEVVISCWETNWCSGNVIINWNFHVKVLVKCKNYNVDPYIRCHCGTTAFLRFSWVQIVCILQPLYPFCVNRLTLKHTLPRSRVSEAFPPVAVAATISRALSNNIKTPPYLPKWRKSLVELDSNVRSTSTLLSWKIALFFSLWGDDESFSSFCLGNTGLYV